MQGHELQSMNSIWVLGTNRISRIINTRRYCINIWEIWRILMKLIMQKNENLKWVSLTKLRRASARSGFFSGDMRCRLTDPKLENGMGIPSRRANVGAKSTWCITSSCINYQSLYSANNNFSENFMSILECAQKKISSCGCMQIGQLLLHQHCRRRDPRIRSYHDRPSQEECYHHP